jgi:hypothetical protein
MDTTAKARLLAVEVLLAEPELLGNDALEGDLYLLREKLLILGATLSSGSERSPEHRLGEVILLAGGNPTAKGQADDGTPRRAAHSPAGADAGRGIA